MDPIHFPNILQAISHIHDKIHCLNNVLILPLQAYEKLSVMLNNSIIKCMVNTKLILSSVMLLE